jgi:hypothetical protein
MAIRKICWRIVLSGDSFVEVDEPAETMDPRDRVNSLYVRAEERLGEIISHEGIPEWTDMETEVTSVGKSEPEEEPEEEPEDDDFNHAP